MGALQDMSEQEFIALWQQLPAEIREALALLIRFHSAASLESADQLPAEIQEAIVAAERTLGDFFH